VPEIGLLTAGLDGTGAVWDPDTGTLLHRLEGHRGGIHGITGSWGIVATGSADGRVGLWDSASGALIRFLDGHEETVTSLRFLDDRTLVSGSRDRTVRLWDIVDGRQIRVLEGHRWWVTKVRIASGRRVVSASEDCTLRVWDPDTGEAGWVFEDCPGPIWGLAVDPGGHHAVVGYGGTAIRVDLNRQTWEKLPNKATVSGRAMSFSRTGDRLAIGNDQGDIDLIDLAEPIVIEKLPGVGRRIISGIVDADLTVVGRIGGEVESEQQGGDAVSHKGHDFFVYSTRRLDERRFATGAFDRTVRIWEVGSTEVLLEFPHGGLIFSLASAAGGRQVLCGGGDEIALWDTQSKERVWHIAQAGVGTHLVAAFGAGEETVAGVGEEPVLKVWQREDGSVLNWPLPDAHNCVIESIPGENRVMVGSAYGRVSLVDLDDGSSVLLHGEHEDWIRIARVSPDARRVVTVSQNGTARLYDRSEGRVVNRFDHPVAIADFDDAGSLHWVDCLGARHQERNS